MDVVEHEHRRPRTLGEGQDHVGQGFVESEQAGGGVVAGGELRYERTRIGGTRLREIQVGSSPSGEQPADQRDDRRIFEFGLVRVAPGERDLGTQAPQTLHRFGGESGRAHTRRGLYEHQVATFAGSGDRSQDRCDLGVPSVHGHRKLCGDRGGRRRRTRRLAASDRVVRGGCLREGLDAQFVVQGAYECSVASDRRAPIAALGLELHEVPVGAFGERVETEPSFCVPHRVGKRTLARGQAAQPIEHVSCYSAEPLGLTAMPIVELGTVA